MVTPTGYGPGSANRSGVGAAVVVAATVVVVVVVGGLVVVEVLVAAVGGVVVGGAVVVGVVLGVDCVATVDAVDALSLVHAGEGEGGEREDGQRASGGHSTCPAIGQAHRRIMARRPARVALPAHSAHMAPRHRAGGERRTVGVVDAPFDLAQTDKLLTTTRAVRRRLDLDRPVPRQLIRDCIEVATQAPAGGNVQRWRWLVVDDPDLKRGLADLYRRAYEPYIEQQRDVVATTGRSGVDGIIASSDHLANVLQDVPALVVPCGLDRVPADGAEGVAQGYYGSLLPAVWSFMLAARSRGLGTAWTTLHLGYVDEAAALLGIPSTVTQLALVPVAYYTGDDFKPGQRRDVNEVIYWNQWRQREE